MKTEYCKPFKQSLFPILLIFIISCCILMFKVLRPAVCRAASYPVTITDSDGNTVTVRKPFSRIISLYPAHTENIVTLGAGSRLVGISRGSRHLKGIPAGCKIVSYRDDLERLLALKPDLVIIRPMISRAHPNLVTGLRNFGITVISLQPTSPGELYSYWKTLGILCGRQEAAGKMISDFRQGLEDMVSMTRLIPPERRPKVYFEAIHRRMKTFAPGSLQIFCLEAAGGINIASDAARVRNTNIAAYGKEKILSKADEIDVFLAQKGRMNQVTRQEIISEPGFQVIKAIRDGRVYLVDEAMVSRPTMQLLKGMEIIHRILYPAPGGRR